LGKRKNVEYTSGRPPLPKRSKGQFNQFRKKKSTSTASAQMTEVVFIEKHQSRGRLLILCMPDAGKDTQETILQHYNDLIYAERSTGGVIGLI
jgi:hypothetical protein